MAYCNTKAIMDSALTRIQDNSTGMRTRLLSWLNDAMRSIANYPREWEFLKVSATLAVTANKATLPADFGRVRSIEAGVYRLADPLSDDDVFNEAIGFTVDATEITLSGLPDATSIVLKYLATMTADYADGTANTIFPLEYQDYFIRYLTSSAYEYDKDNDIIPSMLIQKEELKQLKALDNLRKPRPERSRNGYMSTRG